MAAEIERIIDRKLIRNRVHYLVVWRGFGDDSNTWESRIDLVADNHSAAIRDYEENHKKSTRDGSSTPTSSRSRSPSRGRSPGRPKGSKSSRASKSRDASSVDSSRGRSRSRSNSVSARKKSSASSANSSTTLSHDLSGADSSTESAAATSKKEKRSSRKSKSRTTTSAISEPPPSTIETPATSVDLTETMFVSPKAQKPKHKQQKHKQHSDDDDDDDNETDVLLRSTIQALSVPSIRAVVTAAAAASDEKLAIVESTTTTTTTTTTSSSSDRKATRASTRSSSTSSPVLVPVPPTSKEEHVPVKTETHKKTIALSYEESSGSSVIARKTETREVVETVASASTASASSTTSTHRHAFESTLLSPTTLTSASFNDDDNEDDDGASLLLAQPLHYASTSSVTTTTTRRNDGGVRDLVRKLTQRGWLLSFASVAVVVASLLASQLLPRPDDGLEENAWRAWLPFLTPIVALLLFFHQRDDRASAKWIAIALAWRCAAELLVLIEPTPREFAAVVAAAAAIANVALLLAFGAIVRNREHDRSKATLVALAVSVFALFLADSWVVATTNPALESRVILMSVAVLGIALAPALTATSDDDDE